MQGSVKSLALRENAAEQDKSMNKRLLGPEIKDLLNNLKEILQPTDFSDDLFNRLEDFYQPGKNCI